MSVSQPNVCIFCQASFTRADALKRHWNTCSARREASIEVPKIPSKSRGRRPKACDQCSSLKRACVSVSPLQSCELCTTKRISCSYRRSARKISDQPNRLGRLGADSPNQNIDPDLSTSRIDEGYPTVASQASVTGSTEEPTFSLDDSPWCSAFNWLNHDFTRTLQVEYSIASPYSRRPTDIRLYMATSLPFFVKMTRSLGLAGTFECGTAADRSRIYRCALELGVHRSTTHSESAYAAPNFNEKMIDRQRTPAFANGPQSRPRSTVRLDDPDLLSYQFEPSNIVNDSWIEQATNHSLGSGFSFDLLAESVLLGVSGLIPQSPPFPTQETSSCLPSRCQQIINRLRDATTLQRQNSIISISWSAALERVCLQLFTAANEKKLLALFWSAWYPNWPTIHQPTFDPMESHLDLVITMMLMGACLSPRQIDRSMASIWFNVMEELIFSADYFSSYHDDQLQPTSPIDWLSERLGLLQAGYCICLLQTWEGSKESKRRIRRHRYNSLIWLARDTGFQYANLKSVSTEDLASFDWKAFIVKESFIRIITYIYNLDSAYAIFCSQPPRIFYNELQIDLTAPELCFQANSPEECFVLLKAWRNTSCLPANFSLFLAVQMICSDRTTFSDTLFSQISVLNMFTIIHVLYAITFQVEKLVMPAMDTAWLQKGLENWRFLWPCPSRDEEIALKVGETDTRSIQRTGFTQHAPEIWFLTQSSLNQIIQKRGMVIVVHKDHTELEATEMGHLRSMVDRFRIGVS